MTIRQQERTARGNLNRYATSDMYDIFDAYGRPSIYKVRAWEYCKELCHKFSGWGLKVISRNTSIFTAGFEYADPETGEVIFMYINPRYDIAVSAC